MKTFKIFFEQTEIESLKALISNPDPQRVKEYGGTAYVDMLNKKLEKAQKVAAIYDHLKKSPLSSESEENDGDYIGKNIVYATKDTSGGGITSFTSKGKVVDHNKQYDVITLDNGLRINTNLHYRKDGNLYHKGDFYIDSLTSTQDAEDRCKRKADSAYGKKTSAYKSGAIVRCRKGKIWKKK